MDDKNTSLFRKKNLEKIESPESLNDYLQVTSPGVWLVLITIVVFLIGTCIWGFFGHIDSKAKAAVISENGSTAFCAAERTPVRLPADTRRRQRTAL